MNLPSIKRAHRPHDALIQPKNPILLSYLESRGRDMNLPRSGATIIISIICPIYELVVVEPCSARRSRNRKRPIDKLGFPCLNSTISSFALIEPGISRLAAFVKSRLSCTRLEGLRGTNGVADSVSSASGGRPATGPAAAAPQNFGALVVHSLNYQGGLQCHGQVGEVSCAFL